MSRRDTLLTYTLLSTAAAILLIVIAWNGHKEPGQLSFEDEAIVLAAFMASCVVGIVLSVRPRSLFKRAKRSRAEPPENEEGPRYVAHHPDCGSFEDRVVTSRGKIYCSGCLGLMVGSAAMLAFSLIYLARIELDAMEGMYATLVGLATVVICLLWIASSLGSGWSQVLANSFLVVGFFLVTIGVLSATGDVAFGLVSVVVCFLWLDTRIKVSDWRHSRTCRSCGRGCGFY